MREGYIITFVIDRPGKAIEAHRFIIDEYENLVFENKDGEVCFLIKRDDYFHIEKI